MHNSFGIMRLRQALQWLQKFSVGSRLSRARFDEAFSIRSRVVENDGIDGIGDNANLFNKAATFSENILTEPKKENGVLTWPSVQYKSDFLCLVALCLTAL